jgi:hypothetical protein
MIKRYRLIIRFRCGTTNLDMLIVSRPSYFFFNCFCSRQYLYSFSNPSPISMKTLRKHLERPFRLALRYSPFAFSCWFLKRDSLSESVRPRRQVPPLEPTLARVCAMLAALNGHLWLLVSHTSSSACPVVHCASASTLDDRRICEFC